MRAGLLVVVLLVLPVSAGNPLENGSLEVDLWLVGYDDGVTYPPHLASEPTAGTGIFRPSDSCLARPDPCTKLVASGQWLWAHARVTRDGAPVENASGTMFTPDGTRFLRTNASGEARVLLRPVAAPGEALHLAADFYDRETAEWWDGRFQWRGGPPVETATQELIYGPDEKWENYTLEIVGSGHLVIDVRYGASDPGAPRASYAAISNTVFRDADGPFFGAGSATAGGTEPVVNVQMSGQPPIGVEVQARDPVSIGSRGGIRFEGEVEPGAFAVDFTVARAGLAGDDGWSLHVFGDPTIYQVTSTRSGAFAAAPITYQGVAVRAYLFGPHVGTYRTELNVTTHEHSVVLIGASTNPFTEGDLTLRHDRSVVRAASEGIGGHGVGLWNVAQGDCAGRWTSTVNVRHGVASSYVGAAVAEKLVLPSWWNLDQAPMPCA